MGVIGSLSNGIGVLKRNPVIVAVIFAYTLLGTAASSLQAVDEVLIYPALLVYYLLVPFFLGGIIGMVHDGLSGTTSVDRFFADSKSNYLSLFGGGLILGVILTVFGFIVGFVGIIATIFVVGVGSMAGATSASVIVLAVGGLLSLLIVLLPWFVLQFFPAAIVVDDLGLADSFGRSGALIRRNFLSVLGFDAVAFLVYLIAQIPTGYLFYTTYLHQVDFQQTQGGFQDAPTMFDLFSTPELVIYLTASVVLGTIVLSVLQAYYVAYYDQLLR